MDTMTLRLPRRMSDALLTSQAAQGNDGDPLAERLIATVRKVKPRKDGSRLVTLDADEVAVLVEYAETLEESARDSVSIDPGDSLADIRAARAVLGAVREQRVPSAT